MVIIDIIITIIIIMVASEKQQKVVVEHWIGPIFHHKTMVGRFVEVCRRIGLKINVGKSKVTMLGWEEGLECEVCVNGIRLEHVLEFK